jgi:hypothetical protein
MWSVQGVRRMLVGFGMSANCRQLVAASPCILAEEVGWTGCGSLRVSCAVLVR